MKFENLATRVAIVAVALGLSNAAIHGQDPATPGAPASSAPLTVPAAEVKASDVPNGDPALTVRSEKSVEDFQPPESEEYTLGAGDQLSLDFPGKPELNVKATTIGPDGRITLPLAGPIRIADLTRTEAQKAIADALSPFYTNLTDTVSIDKYSSNRVRVLGYVVKPGEIIFEETPTLLDAIARAGLISASSTTSKEGAVAVGTGNSIPETCTIYRGKSALIVRLREYMTSGNALAEMRLRRNDIVYVPEPKEQFVSVLGEVNHPGTIPLTSQSSLTSVLAIAGGFTEAGGDNPVIHLLEPSTGKVLKVPYKKLITLAGQKEFPLHSGDVIVINKTGFYKATYYLQRISPVATMVSLAALVGAG